MPDGSLVIGAAGIYHGVPMEQYLACEAIAAHDLFNFYDRCPAYAIARHPSHPNPEPDRESDALALGELAHALILEGDAVVARRYAVKPAGMKFNTKAGMEWEAAHSHLEIVTAADMEAARAIQNAVLNSAKARRSLEGCGREVTLLAKDPETGLAIKNRPDAMRSNLVVNIKTAANAHPRKWAADALKYGYHVSEAMTAHILKTIGAPPRSYIYVVIEKAKRNPIVQVRTLPDTLGALGEAILHKSLRGWAKCAETGNWPPYHDDVKEMDAPPWALAELERLQQEG
jgi:hypothetical protein